MGPITLFDKSFLQSLSLDESVWFDHFFLANVCPLFYVETLADLDKSVREGRTSEQEVEIIADKFPETGGMPNAYHASLCLGELRGHAVPMTGQIPVSGGHLIMTDGKSGTVFEQSPESEAFERWQRGDFLEIERRFARAWRGELVAHDLGEVAKEFRVLGIDAESCKSLEAAKALAQSVTSRRDKQSLRIMSTLVSLNIPRRFYQQIVQRWSLANYPPLVDFAPYATYVLTVELFFKIALVANLIASERPSNRVDISYLFYLPFCMMFVSFDKLHQRCAPLFLRNDQEFVWGLELKRGLGELNTHYLQLPDSTRQKGIYSFAVNPPEIGAGIVAQLWDRFLPKWRKRQETNAADEPAPESAPTKEEIERMAAAPALSPDAVDFDPLNTGRVLIKRRIRRRKGAWYQVPKDLKTPDDW